MKRLFALALLLPLLGGCFGSGKNPVKVVVPAPGPFPIPSSPRSVLYNLIRAYAERDTTHYKACYDLTYMGGSYSGYVSQPGPGTYTFDDEAAHIRFLQRSTMITRVTLDLPNYQAATIDTLSGDPPGWVTMSIYNPKVEIDDATGSLSIATGEVFQFKFLRKTPDPTSPTDTSWTIVRWAEIAPSSP